jgi:hypothetical protein
VWRFDGKEAHVLALLASGPGVAPTDTRLRLSTLRRTIETLCEAGLEIDITYEGELEQVHYWLRTVGTLTEEEPSLHSEPVGRVVWERAQGKELLRAVEVENAGTCQLDLRKWVDEGSTPTPKGVRMPVEAVRGLAQALTAYAAKMGFSGPENGSEGRID